MPFDGVLSAQQYRHWEDAPWDMARWPNFKPHEFACRHCGEFFYDERMYDQLQFVRNFVGKPTSINSAHRCRIYNRRIGGAPYSRHLRLAFDISAAGWTANERIRLRSGCDQAGFRTFGYYGTFLHTDDRPTRTWWTSKGKVTWNFLLI